MTPILLNQLRSLISSSIISKFSKKFEENEALLIKSIDTSICTVLIGLNNVIDNTILYDKILTSIACSEFYESTTFENGKLSSINNSFETEGSAPLHLIFSNKKGRVSEMISNEIGVKSETAYAILNFVVMVILSHFHKEKQTAKNIQHSLNEEKKAIIRSIPQGIRLIIGCAHLESGDDIYSGTNQLTDSNSITLFLNKIFRF
jgi:hypothetical protein